MSRSFIVLEDSNDHAGRKFNPLVLDEIHAADDSRVSCSAQPS